MKFLKTAMVFSVAFVFLAAGISKFAGAPGVVEIFERFGLPRWFMLATGAIELIGALSLLAPARRARFFGGALLSVTMIVGAAFHVAVDPPPAAIPAILLALATGAIAAANAGGNVRAPAH